jgi:uncharacterized radical SAM superfamily Fe-S cluster-containing enzyme
MKSQTLTTQHLKEEIFSKFGTKFLIKDNKVYLINKFCNTLIENDADYFTKMIKTCEKTEFSSFKLHSTIQDKDWELIRKKIRSITLNITNRCNSNCNMCFVKESLPYEELTTKEIKIILSKIGKNKQVILFGGEPTLRKDLFEIIDLIKKSDNIPIIYTNGLKLADNNYIKKLKESGVNKIHFSFDGFRENIYEELRGSRKQFYIKLKALKNLEKYNFKVILASIIASGINEDEVSKLLKFSIKNNHFIQTLALFGATPYGRFNIKIKKYLTPSDLIKLLEEASNGVINKEYIIEFKKLRNNLYQILKKMGIYFPFGNHDSSISLFKIEGNQIKHFIPLKELKEINKELENKKFTSLMKYLFTKRGLLFIKLLLRNLKLETLGNDILGIHVANILTPLNNFTVEVDDKIIEKIRDKILKSGQGD